MKAKLRLGCVLTGIAAMWGGCASVSTSPDAVVVTAEPPELEVEAEFPHQQVTGVAVSSSGRTFVNFPYWSDGHTLSVAEVEETGRLKPIPDEAWNAKSGPVEHRFVCVQSVHVDDEDTLWIVDAGSPKQTGVVEGGAKLVRVNLGTNEVAQVIRFAPEVAPERSYLNDVRVDTKNQYAFLTDSNLGALVVVDLRTGAARRVLDNDPSVQPEPNLALKVQGNVLMDPEKQQPLAIASDGIAIDPVGRWLYYKALTGHTLYRIPLQVLETEGISEAEIAQRIERVGRLPVSDGLAYRDGKIYVTAIEEDAVVAYDVVTRQSETIAQDAQLRWPDSLAFTPEGDLLVTTSQIHLTPKFNRGEMKVNEPYRVFRVPVPDALVPAE